MIELVNKNTAIMALQIEYADLKRNKAYGTCGGVRRAITVLEQLSGVEYEGVKSPKAERVCQVEPFFKNGLVGREVWRCSVCANEIRRTDKYCANCGRKLEDPHE